MGAAAQPTDGSRQKSLRRNHFSIIRVRNTGRLDVNQESDGPGEWRYKLVTETRIAKTNDIEALTA